MCSVLPKAACLNQRSRCRFLRSRNWVSISLTLQEYKDKTVPRASKDILIALQCLDKRSEHRPYTTFITVAWLKSAEVVFNSSHLGKPIISEVNQYKKTVQWKSITSKASLEEFNKTSARRGVFSAQFLSSKNPAHCLSNYCNTLKCKNKKKKRKCS